MPRGRSRQDQRPTKRERVSLIVGLMTSGQWITGQSSPLLARQWGFSVKMIEADAAEASRTVRNAVASQEDIRASVLATLEFCRARAIDRGEFRSAIRACEAIAGVMGLARLTLNIEEQKPAIIISKAEDEDEPSSGLVSPPSDAGSQT